MFRRLLLISVIINILVVNLAACGSQPQQAPQYDPAKKYAAFLVANTAYSEDALNSVKEKSTRDGYEIGPVVYYDPGTKDFEALVTKLLPSKQIALVWVSGSLLDTPNIQKAIAAAQYKGLLRYMPVTGPSNQ